MDVSMIVSSFNQKTRLNFCLQSLAKQELDFDWEIILADDNSTDGTLDMVRDKFPFVNIQQNPKSESGVYTLADNWNNAAKVATGKRIVFSNADLIYSKYFLAAHMDPIMQDCIIFGPGYCSKPESEKYINNLSNIDSLVKKLDNEKLIGKDRHAEGSADTYNVEWAWNFPFGYNFSVIKEQFDGVGGFPPYRRWGSEETHLCKKIVNKYKTKVKSNKYAFAIHLWHPIVNSQSTEKRDDSILF